MACIGLANSYYQAVKRLGGNVFLAAQIGAELKRRLIIKILSHPPSTVNSPFANFKWQFSNGYATSTSCLLDGKLQALCPVPANFTVGKGTHTVTFTATNGVGPVKGSFTWRAG